MVIGSRRKSKEQWYEQSSIQVQQCYTYLESLMMEHIVMNPRHSLPSLSTHKFGLVGTCQDCSTSTAKILLPWPTEPCFEHDFERV